MTPTPAHVASDTPGDGPAPGSDLAMAVEFATANRATLRYRWRSRRWMRHDARDGWTLLPRGAVLVYARGLWALAVRRAEAAEAEAAGLAGEADRSARRATLLAEARAWRRATWRASMLRGLNAIVSAARGLLPYVEPDVSTVPRPAERHCGAQRAAQHRCEVSP